MDSASLGAKRLSDMPSEWGNRRTMLCAGAGGGAAYGSIRRHGQRSPRSLVRARWRNAKGVAHPFGTVFTAALPVAQMLGASGRDLLTAFVAGSEALLRIGKATGRSNEHRGFHASGTTGPFGQRSPAAC